MINILTTKLPDAIIVSCREYKIDTDFRSWIKLNELLMNKKTPQEEVLKFISNLFLFDIPDNGEEAIVQIIKFFERRTEELNPVNSNKKQKQVFSYLYDSEYIVSAFQEFYNIDLLSIDYMHWWRFNLLLTTLSAECELKERIRYRTINSSKIKDGKERKRIRMIQSAIALPDTELSDEEIASALL